MNLQDTLDAMAMAVFGRTKRAALVANECLRCRKPVNADELPTEDAIEYSISGFCPACFEEVAGDE